MGIFSDLLRKYSRWTALRHARRLVHSPVAGSPSASGHLFALVAAKVREIPEILEGPESPESPANPAIPDIAEISVISENPKIKH